MSHATDDLLVGADEAERIIARASEMPPSFLPLRLARSVLALHTQLAAVTAERDAARADVDRFTLACAVPGLITMIVRKILGAVDGEATLAAAQRVVRERDDLRDDLREAERNATDAEADRAIAEEVTSALYLAARAAGYEGGDHWQEGDGSARGAEMLALVRAAARREGAEGMRGRARQRTEAAAVAAGEVDNTVTRRWLLSLAQEINALPLDGEATTDAAEVSHA